MKIRPWDNPSNRVYKIILVLDSNSLYTECGTRSHEKALMKNFIYVYDVEREEFVNFCDSLDSWYNKTQSEFMTFYNICIHCTVFSCSSAVHISYKYISMWDIHEISHVLYIILFKREHVKIKEWLVSRSKPTFSTYVFTLYLPTPCTWTCVQYQYRLYLIYYTRRSLWPPCRQRSLVVSPPLMPIMPTQGEPPAHPGIGRRVFAFLGGGGGGRGLAVNAAPTPN
jgi:hypothetical protein